MFGRFPQVPSNRGWTVALLVLWLLLAIYILWARDPLGYVILILVGLFAVLPALILWTASRRSGHGIAGELGEVDRGDEHAAPHDDLDRTGGTSSM